MTSNTPKRLTRVMLLSLNQYRAGCKWLAEHGGNGTMWMAPPLWPFKSRKQWWSNVYGDQFIFWFKDDHIKTLFLLSLPPPEVFLF